MSTLIDGMAPWWEKVKIVRNASDRDRHAEGWDSGVLAAAEFVRRAMNYDETLALRIHGLLTSEIARRQAGREGDA